VDKGKAKKERGPGYWERRKNSLYLRAAEAVCRRFGGSPASVIDVGSNGTPTLEWHRSTASKLVSVDLKRPYRAEGVESIISDFLVYEPDSKFDLVTCFQVLEHLPSPEPFARKLLSLGKVVVVSVPYKWPKGKCLHHPQDPVDEAKLKRWFGRNPDFSHLSIEVEFDHSPRLVQVYCEGSNPRFQNAWLHPWARTDKRWVSVRRAALRQMGRIKRKLGLFAEPKA
jgi:Methyltransferase domain